MKAMLLAAGLGTRMLPLTLTAPKPLLPVLGRAMACQTLRRLARFGVEQAVLNLHHMPDQVRDRLGDGNEDGLPAPRCRCPRRFPAASARGCSAARCLPVDGCNPPEFSHAPQDHR